MGTNNFGSGKDNHKVTSDLHKGLSNKSPKFVDKSFNYYGGASVSSDTTRSSTAPTPKTLGPRTA